MNLQRDDAWSVPGRLVLCAIAIEFCVSANLLTWIGVPYMTEGGALPVKIHPGTYTLGAAFLLHCAGQRRPNGFFWAVIGQDRWLAIYLIAIVSCLCYALVTTGTGNLIVLIDTFLPAGLAAVVLQAASLRELHALRRLLQWGVMLNAVLALGEAAAHASLVPLYLNSTEYQAPVEEFRPTALYDHPLTGGVMTMIGLALPPRPGVLRCIYTCVLLAAMLAFGGRVAAAAVAMSWVFLVCFDLGRRVLQRDRRAAQLCISYLGVVPIGTACVATALCAGLGSRLTRHLYWDPSAQVRLAQWNLIGELTPSQMVFGAARKDLIALLSPLWLNSGVEVIENFWLLMFASLGAAGFLIFCVGFSSLLYWCWSRTNLRGRVLLFTVILVASTSNSLGRKSTLLVGLVAAISCVSIKRANLQTAIAEEPRGRLVADALVGAA
jgi:hypothetical protein